MPESRLRRQAFKAQAGGAGGEVQFMKTIQRLMLAGAAATSLMLAGCAEGPVTYGGPYYQSPYYAYYGPYYTEGGGVVLGRGFYGHHYYGHGLARAGGFHHGGGGFHHR